MKIMEFIHEAAYKNNTLGNSLYPTKYTIEHFNTQTCKQFTQQFFTPKRMVICGVGIDHDLFTNLVETNFNNLPAESSIVKQAATYTGGEIRQHEKGAPLSHFAIAFETASWHSEDLVPMCVLQQLLGGGGSFSAGGPGKGMYSRLYTNILNKYEYVESCQAFNSIFNDSSLFGIYATCTPEKLKLVCEALIAELKKCTGSFTPIEVTRGKQQLKSAVHMQLASRSLRLEDIGRQVMTYGKIQTPEEISNLIEKVTEQDLQRVAQKMLATPPSIAAIGDLSHLPRYDQIQKLCK
jgi:processing peptidase subunit alpha